MSRQTKHIWPIPKIEFIPFTDIEESRDVALVTSLPAWVAVKDRLHLPIVWQANIVEAGLSHWNALAATIQGEVVYTVGGGLAADAGKYLAAKHDLALVCLPTALSVDAFLTWASGIRQGGCVRYLETKPPDHLVVDLQVLASAPACIRAAGICDVLSIATGSWDWRFAAERDKNPAGMEYIPYVDRAAAAILGGAMDCAEAAGYGEPEALKQLLDCLALEVQLCNQIGHARPEEGSEHYFAYAVENQLGKGLPHGDLVGPGILLMAERQGQDTAALRHVLEICHIPLTKISEDVAQSTLQQLPGYVRRHKLPYGIAHELW